MRFATSFVKYLCFFVGALSSLVSVASPEQTAIENRILNLWREHKSPIIFVQKMDLGEWDLNSPSFCRDNFSSDGTTRLTFAQIVLSTSPNYVSGSLVLIEERVAVSEEQQKNSCPFLLIHVCDDTASIPLNKDKTAFYIWVEPTYVLSGEVLLSQTSELQNTWANMRDIVSQWKRSMR